jgi:hypothetical protein
LDEIVDYSTDSNCLDRYNRVSALVSAAARVDLR